MEKKSTLTNEEKETFMRAAIEEAKKAQALDEVPIGAVVVWNKKSLLQSRSKL